MVEGDAVTGITRAAACDRPALPRSAARGRLALAGSRLAAARRSGYARTFIEQPDGHVLEQHEDRPAGANETVRPNAL